MGPYTKWIISFGSIVVDDGWENVGRFRKTLPDILEAQAEENIDKVYSPCKGQYSEPRYTTEKTRKTPVYRGIPKTTFDTSVYVVTMNIYATKQQ